MRLNPLPSLCQSTQAVSLPDGIRAQPAYSQRVYAGSLIAGDTPWSMIWRGHFFYLAGEPFMPFWGQNLHFLTINSPQGPCLGCLPRFQLLFTILKRQAQPSRLLLGVVPRPIMIHFLNEIRKYRVGNMFCNLSGQPKTFLIECFYTQLWIDCEQDPCRQEE